MAWPAERSRSSREATPAESLDALLRDSRLFKLANILSIRTEDDIGKCEKASVFLVHWSDFHAYIDEVLKYKRDGTALIVYAPQDHGPVPAEALRKLNSERNFALSKRRRGAAAAGRRRAGPYERFPS
jgi:hypothetical protein